MKIVADAHIPFVEDYFKYHGELILKPGRTIQKEDVKDADVLLVRSITRVDEKLLSDSKVKFVGSVTAGADHLDVAWLDAAGIDYATASGFNALPVADYVVSIIAALTRKKLLPARPKAAVIGVGHVGKLVVEKLKLFGFDIALCDPLRAQRETSFVSTPSQALTDLDFISLHVPLIYSGEDPTLHLVDNAFIQRQKPGCIMLNTSRGSVVDSKAMLQSGDHLHWCLDVWEDEPKINKTILAKSLIATPHIAGYSVQSKIRGIAMIYQIACQKKIIQPQAISPIPLPRQRLTFAGPNHHWSDIVLGILNPLIVTHMMRTLLLPATDYGYLFDQMRNQFNYRYELAYTDVDAAILAEDQVLLKQLGVGGL